jgi:MFS family permease
MGAGALVAAVSMALFGRRASRLVISGATVSFSLFSIAFALSGQFALSLALMVGIGVSTIALMTNANSLVQTSSPDNLRGRVMSVYTMVFGGVTPFGSFYAGALADLWGPQWTMGLSALFCAAAGVLSLLSGWHRRPAPVTTEPEE